MANIAELNIRLGVRYRDFDRSMKQVESRLRQTAQAINGVADSMLQSFTAPLVGIGALAIKAAGDFEALKLAMNTTMKDAGYSTAETTKELEALRKVALAPGIDLEQAVKGSIALQSVGFNAERARKTLVELANGIAGAGGNADQLEGVTRQFAQMSAKGVVLQQDLAIIKENMPSVVKAMREAFGTTTAEGIRNAGISADQFIDGITEQLSKNARVQGGIKNAIDNTRSAITQFFAAIGDGINEAYNLNAVAGAMSDKLGQLASMFKNLDPETKKSIFNFALYAAGFPILLKGMGLLFGAGQQLVVGIRLVGDVMKNASGTVLGFVDKLSKLKAAMAFAYVGAAVAIIAALYLGFQKLSEETDKALHVTNALNEVEKEAIKSQSAQRSELDLLMRTVKDETLSQDQRTAALKRMQELYPKYFENLNVEKLDISKLTSGYEALKEEILKTARAKAGNAKLEKISEESLTFETERNKLIDYYNSALTQSSENALFNNAVTQKGRDEVERSFANQRKAFKENLDALDRNIAAKKREEDAIYAVVAANSAETEAQKQIRLEREKAAAASAKAQAAQAAGNEKTKSGTKSVASVFKEVTTELANINKQAAALGATGGEDHFNDFANGIERGIGKLIEAGAKVDGKEIEALKKLAREGLGAQLTAPDLLPTSTGISTPVSDTAASAIPDVRIQYDKDALEGFLSDSQKIGQVLAEMKAGTISASEGFDAINAILATTNESFTGTGLKVQEMSFAFQALGEQFKMLGESFQAGGEGQKAIFDAVGASIAQLTNEGSVNMKDFAKAALASSIKVAKAYAVQGIFAAVSKALQSVPFPINLIAAAGAAGVASALLNGLANKISAPKLAKGGLAYGQTLATVGDNPNAGVDPEVIAPLSKLKDIIGGGASSVNVGGTFRIRGEDLIYTIEKANTMQSRRYGK